MVRSPQPAARSPQASRARTRYRCAYVNEQALMNSDRADGKSPKGLWVLLFNWHSEAAGLAPAVCRAVRVDPPGAAPESKPGAFQLEGLEVREMAWECAWKT